MLCERIGKDPTPGPGFLTLYQFVVSRIQQVLLGKERPSSDKISEVKKSKQKWLKKIREAGIITINNHEAGPELCSDIAGVFYDDTGAQNPIFRRYLPMAAFDDTSQGFARLIGINLLSNADIRYDDGKDNTFEGHEDIEDEIENILGKLRAPLFAFRAFAAFIPEAQRLKVGEETYNRRWEMFRNLKVEVVPMLRISIGGKPPKEIPPEFPVVLEHKSKARREKRLFIRESTLSGDNQVPLRILARPLAVALGAEAQTIAVEMLLTQYNDGLDSVHTYLSEQCGVTRDQVREIEELDDKFVTERNNQIRVLEEKIVSSISRCCPECQLGENEIFELRELLSRSLSVNSPALLNFLQNRLQISLHVVSEELGIKKITSNIHTFNAMKELYKQKLLLMVAGNKGISSPGKDWKEIFESYNDLKINKELQYRWQPTDGELIEPIDSWLSEFNVSMPGDDGYMIISEEEQTLWDRLNPEKPGAYDSETNKAVLNVFVPWVIALCKSSVALPVTDLLDALDEYGMEEMINDSEPLDEIRERLEEFLKRYHVAQASVEALFSNWPAVSSEGTGVKIDFIEKVRIDIEQHRSRQKSRSKKLVKKYVEYISGLIAENKVGTSPISVEFTKSEENESKETPPTQKTDSPKLSPHKQRRNAVGEEDFIAANFRNRVVGECGENFVLEIQRLQWKSLSQAAPEEAREYLKKLKQYYDFGKRAEDVDWQAKWEFLEKMDPAVWTEEEHWAVLRSLIYMAEWSTSAGYDILGLFQNYGVGNWQIMCVEVKATRGKYKLDFPISRNELKAAEHNGDSYVIWRVLNVSRGRIPDYLLLTNPIRMITEGKITTMDQVTILKPNLTLGHK